MTAEVRPIATAPIGGVEYFPPKAPKDAPLDFVLLWRPAHDRWPGGWRLGFWERRAWYDDDMGLMEPQPTHWAPLPAQPLALAGDIDAARGAISVAGKARRLPAAEFRLFEILYRADLVDGKWRSAAWLCRQLGEGGKRPPECRGAAAANRRAAPRARRLALSRREHRRRRLPADRGAARPPRGAVTGVAVG